jgi:ABC-type transporter Mla maintaining outer membrane lipid asymmetry permease subunit MlaE
MRIEEQIDALECIAIVRFLPGDAETAALVALPLLTAILMSLALLAVTWSGWDCLASTRAPTGTVWKRALNGKTFTWGLSNRFVSLF